MDLSKPIGNDPNFHIELRNYREALGLSIKEFANKLGAHPNSIRQWEHEFENSPYCTRPGPSYRKALSDFMKANPVPGKEPVGQTNYNVAVMVIQVGSDELKSMNVANLKSLMDLAVDAQNRATQAIVSSVRLQEQIEQLLKQRT